MKYAPIAMRVLNVVTAASALWILLRTLIFFVAGVSDWYVFLFVTFFPVLCALAFVAAVSYIFFGSLKIWHKPRASDVQ